MFFSTGISIYLNFHLSANKIATNFGLKNAQIPIYLRSHLSASILYHRSKNISKNFAPARSPHFILRAFSLHFISDSGIPATNGRRTRMQTPCNTTLTLDNE